MTEKLNKFLSEYIRVIFLLVVIFLFIRVLEYTYAASTTNENLSAGLFFTRSLNLDCLFLFLYSAILIIPFGLVSLINFKLFRYVNLYFALSLVFIDLALTQYFLTNNSLLTSQLFEFSFTEIKDIIFSEFTSGRLIFWLGVLTVLILSVYLFFKRKELKGKLKTALFVTYGIGLVFALLNMPYTYKELKYFDSNYQYLIGNSKISYFIKSYYLAKEKNSAFNFFDSKKIENEIEKYKLSRKEFNFSDKEFPFTHNEPYKNVLGNYFKLTTTKPNVVIIISESLSASISGRQNLLGSLTPFTDSLMTAGLSWNYFLANANRSYGALPNILASAPPGVNERGFINTTVEYPDHKKYPEHTTLINLLKQNGYSTNYYYGGWGWFDNTGYYLKEKNIDNFICEDDFHEPKYKKKKGLGANQVWGYNDKELFELSMELFIKHIVNKPFLSVYQTISNHSPFNLSEDAYYEDNYLDKKLASLKINKDIYGKMDKKIISSVFFADDALKYYFESFRKRPEFNNTIFIITGDHSLGLKIDKNACKNFWVPLIIYSPLINKPAQFNGLCSHVDILPSLLALLQQNYGCAFPESKHWVGEGLDTSRNFNSHNFIPLNLTAMDMPNFIVKDHVLYGDEIFKLETDLKIIKENDKVISESTREKINTFNYLNNYVCLKNKIAKP